MRKSTKALIRNVGGALPVATLACLGLGPGSYAHAQAAAPRAITITLSSAQLKSAPLLSVQQALKVGGEPGDTMFGYLTALDVGPTGDVYTADQRRKEIRVFDAGGRLLRTFGRSGAAGELDGPDRIIVDKDSVFVNDARVITVFTTNGSFVRYITPDTKNTRNGMTGYYHVQMLARVPGGLVATLPDAMYANHDHPDPYQDTVRFRSVDMQTGMLPIIPVSSISADMYHISNFGMTPAFFGTSVKSAVSRDGRIFLTNADGKSIDVVKLDGTQANRIVFDAERVPVTKEQVDKRIGDMIAQYESFKVPDVDAVRARLHEIPAAPALPVLGDIVAGQNGEILVARADIGDVSHPQDGTTTWMYLTPDFKVRGKIELPTAFKPFAVNGNSITGILRGAPPTTDRMAVGSSSVVRYQITR